MAEAPRTEYLVPSGSPACPLRARPSRGRGRGGGGRGGADDVAARAPLARRLRPAAMAVAVAGQRHGQVNRLLEFIGARTQQVGGLEAEVFDAGLFLHP